MAAISATGQFALASALHSPADAATIAAAVAGGGSFTVAAVVAALTDSSGGAAADGTIGAVTAPTALTDNGGGTADGTVASNAAATTLTDSTGLSGTHDDTLAATTVDALTAAAIGDLTATQNTGWGASTEAGFDSISTQFDALLADVTAIRALNLVVTQNASDTAQKVMEIVTWQTTVSNNFKELTTRQAENRTAIVALTDAVKELATKVNEILTSVKAAGQMAAA